MTLQEVEKLMIFHSGKERKIKYGAFLCPKLNNKIMLMLEIG